MNKRSRKVAIGINCVGVVLALIALIFNPPGQDLFVGTAAIALIGGAINAWAIRKRLSA